MFWRAIANYTHCIRVKDALKYTRIGVHPASLHRLQYIRRNKQLKLTALSGQCMQQRRNICRFSLPTAIEVRGIVLLVGNSFHLPTAKQTFPIAFLESFEMFSLGAHPQ